MQQTPYGLALGIDVGTGGVRVVVAGGDGVVLAEAARGFANSAEPPRVAGYIEQDPGMWWNATRECLCDAVAILRRVGRHPEEIVAAAVDSTSGTVVLLDGANRPLRPALMYNDRRAADEAVEVNSIAGRAGAGCRFNSSFALPKLLWLCRHEPRTWDLCKRVVHAADYIVAQLSGESGVTDQSNALKTGFDLQTFEWPGWIENLGIPRQRLPRVIRSGERIARISAECARETGLSTGTWVVAGATDATADQFASGANQVGDWNTVIGTTLVFKGMTRTFLNDPEGRVYCHLHPMGFWMPGGASNVGAAAIDQRFPGIDKKAMDAAALSLSPTGVVVYPLVGRGERFPFARSDAEAFTIGTVVNSAQLYAAFLEGVAFTERLGFEVFTGLEAEIGQRVFTTGGGARSLEWMQIRADVLGRQLVRAANPNATMGSAIIAASRHLHGDLAQAAAAMVRIEAIVEPRRAMMACYEEMYGRFRAALWR